MRVVLAEVHGMCFGVRDALLTLGRLQRPDEVTIHGELVHNETILADLRRRGFAMADETRRELPATDKVLVTAHGISDRERQRLLDAGKHLIDTTCPLVARAHGAARRLASQGYHVLLVGKRGHVEVNGLVGDLDSFDVLEGPEEVRRYPHRRLGLMAQTTAPARLVSAVRDAVVLLNPDAELRFVDTVCQPTKDHQRALERLLDEVMLVVVVGGCNSNNTRALVARCRERGRIAHHVQSAADLRPEWFAGHDCVGLTAGTSTPAEAIAEVERWLERHTAKEVA